MTDSHQSIREDYDHDADEVFSETLATLNTQVNQTEQLEEEIDQLVESAVAVETFGMTPSAFATMQLTGLLAGTSLEAIALESARGVCPSGDQALESLVGKIKEKTTQWADKILHFMNDMSQKILGMFSKMYDGLVVKLKALDQSLKSGAKTAVSTARAHPVATVMTALAAGLAVGGVIVFVSSGMPLATAGEVAMREFVGKTTAMIEKIKPVGKVIKATASGAGTKLVVGFEKVAAQGKAAAEMAGGWTQSTFRVVGTKLTEMYTMIKRGVMALAHKVISAMRTVDKVGGDAGVVAGAKFTQATGSKLGGWATTQAVNRGYTTALWALIGAAYKLLKSVALKAFYMVKDVVYGLKPKDDIVQAQPA